MEFSLFGTIQEFTVTPQEHYLYPDTSDKLKTFFVIRDSRAAADCELLPFVGRMMGREGVL